MSPLPKSLRRARRHAATVESSLRRVLAVGDSGTIFFAPGALIGMRLLLAYRRTNRIFLSTEEYYGSRHFAGLVVDDDMATIAARATAADAVLTSVVSWKGRPSDDAVTTLRWRTGLRPMVMVDYSHAGAIGFPPALGLGADIVIGDVDKWLTPVSILRRDNGCAFMWSNNATIEADLSNAIGGFALARPDAAAGERETLARWIDPNVFARRSKELARIALARPSIVTHHTANMALAKRVSRELDLSEPRSAIVWCPTTRDPSVSRLFGVLNGVGMVWTQPDGYRICCRQDVLASV